MSHKIVTTLDRNSPLSGRANPPPQPPRVIIKEVPVLVPGPPGPAGPQGPPGSGSEKVQSVTGAFTVAASVDVGDLVYLTGDYSGDRASYTATTTAPAVGVVQDKPTGTTATLVFSGLLDGFSGLTPGDELFLGITGGIITSSSLPTSPGNVVQRVGVAVDATTILFSFAQPVEL